MNMPCDTSLLITKTDLMVVVAGSLIFFMLVNMTVVDKLDAILRELKQLRSEKRDEER